MSCETLDRYSWGTSSGTWDTAKNENKLDLILKCQGLCGPDHYIDMDLDVDPPSASCRSCGSIVNVENSQYSDQCSPDTWFQSQKDVNVQKINLMRNNWEYVNLVTIGADGICTLTGEGSEEDRILGCEILNYYTQSDLPLFDGQLLEMFGLPSTTSDNEIQNLRQRIHENRGSKVTMNPRVMTTWNTNFQNLPPSDMRKGFLLGDLEYTEGSKYTSKHIIYQEAYEYQLEIDSQEVSDTVSGFNFQQMFQGTASSSEFEVCMNSLLEDKNLSKTYCNDKTHHEIHEKISSATSVLDLQACHIDYIEDKLKTISIINLSDAKRCMDMLNIAESFNCEQPVSTKMLHISYLIFHIIGLDNIDLSQIKEGSQDYYQLTRIIDRLTPYIRQAIKRIIDISKHYEEQTCGRESTTTHVLERIYIDLFEKSREVSIDINAMDFIPNYIIKDTNIVEFAKIIITMIVMIAGIYVLLMILNRPPYPVKST